MTSLTSSDGCGEIREFKQPEIARNNFCNIRAIGTPVKIWTCMRTKYVEYCGNVSEELPKSSKFSKWC